MGDVTAHDAFRSVRQFVGALNGALNGEQTYAGQDGAAASAPRGFESVGPASVSVEGTTASTAKGGVTIPAPMLWAGVAVVAFLVLK